MHCECHYGNAGRDQSLNFALYHALRSIGLPCLGDTPSAFVSPEGAVLLDKGAAII